ncbi:MAG: peptide chain release factor 2 [Lachnospirales bacterium]
MIVLEEILQEIKKYNDMLVELREICKIDECNKVIAKQELLMNDESFWNDVDKSKNVLKEVKILKNKVAMYNDLYTEYEEVTILTEMAIDETAESYTKECVFAYENFVKQYNKVNMVSLYKGQYDEAGAIVTIHAGAGGTESCDWVTMLLRMYTKYANKNGYKVDIIDKINGDEAGIKTVTVEVSGDFAYGNLKGEKGVHRLVRISPFDSSGKRHTSFASVDIMPVIEEDDDVVEINVEDIRIDTFRASGAGGQHINTTDSAIRITHLPTNIVVQCQNERSQHKNKDMAMKMLKAKLYENMERERREKLDEIRGDVLTTSFGSQIRSYVFHPYNLVKDHVTLEETGNAMAVMEGEIDRFILSYLKYINGNAKKLK